MNYKINTPTGLNDILTKECKLKRELESAIVGVFESYAYNELQTPTFEFYDVFSRESGMLQQESMYKFLDREGRILALRPDITTSIARIMSTKLKAEPLPQRLYYIGNVFRHGEAYGDLLREFTQAGIECIGVNSPYADAEVISVTISSLLAAGLEEFKIELGQIAYFKGIMEQAGLCSDKVEEIRALIDKKDSVSLQRLAKEYIADENIRNVVEKIPSLFGGEDIIQKGHFEGINDKSKAALENLKAVYNILKDYGLEQYISVDLGMLQSLDYYTGIIFKGFTKGTGFSVCGGGRYDNLIGEFGAPMPATGVAIGINRLVNLMMKKNIVYNELIPDTLIFGICYTGPSNLIASALRLQGLKVECYIGGQDLEEAKKYAKDKGIGGIVNVISDNEVETINLHTDQTKSAAISELIGGII